MKPTDNYTCIHISSSPPLRKAYLLLKATCATDPISSLDVPSFLLSGSSHHHQKHTQDLPIAKTMITTTTFLYPSPSPTLSPHPFQMELLEGTSCICSLYLHTPTMPFNLELLSQDHLLCTLAHSHGHCRTSFSNTSYLICDISLTHSLPFVSLIPNSHL